MEKETTDHYPFRDVLQIERALSIVCWHDNRMEHTKYDVCKTEDKGNNEKTFTLIASFTNSGDLFWYCANRLNVINYI